MDRKGPTHERKNPSQVTDGDRMTTPGLTPGTGMRRVEPEGAASKAPRRIGYGLPCSHCGTYYAADVNACPVCGSAERVSPSAAPPVPTADIGSVAAAPEIQPVDLEGEAAPDDAQVVAERDRFLRDYKAKLFATSKLNAAVTFRCTLDKNHSQEYEPASVCKSCYDEMEQRADRLDAALRIDLKEAAQIIYDAVWSDPTPGDPGRTYRNAAEALLVELQRRAGVTVVLTSVKPYTH